MWRKTESDWAESMPGFFFFFLNKFIYFNWRLLIYNIVVVFAIHWHEPAMGVHVSPILNPLPLPPPSSSHPSGLSQCIGFECPVSCIDLGLVIYFTYGNIHVSMLLSQIILPLPSPTEPKSLFFTSVSLLLSHIQGHCCHRSKSHIYALVYCTGVFLSGLLQSV